ncbi:hypothetical protein BJ322DRAFT_253081 [Thelephora terrestris]|uniref:Uncharacterized protein n=1 Tax=Thelephora terrestris TaxID=56493 RepID=A0A9P6H7R2_9AGAM|nr:hypothetical protein BJ322DRAFT_253081 [Thelephora terrestris]
MAGRLLLATTVAFAVGCVAVSLYDVLVGVYEYNSRQEPEKRPYEHSNHSDETLVDSIHELIKPHEVPDSEGPPSPQRTPSTSDSSPNNSPRFNQTPTPPPTPPSTGPWPVKERKPPKGRVIIIQDTMPSDEESSTPLSVLPPDVLGASFSKFEVQETIEQVLERMQSR